MRIPRIARNGQLIIAFVTYGSILLLIRHFDLVIFTEMGTYVEKVRFQSRNHLTPLQYSKAYHLDDKFRNPTSDVPVILIWSPPFGAVWPLGDVEDGCVRTHDRTAISVAKAVVFHFAEIHDDPYWLPLHRREASQRWVWLCMEPPTLTRNIFHKSLTPLNGVFNLTMTYRTDSDILGNYQQTPARLNRTVKQMLQNKRSSAMGIWLVSNCKSTFRNKLIETLQQYIKIDVKGKCTGDPLCRGPCEITTVSSYKFVFTLENSRCQDYITEKFFKFGLNTEAVPVVLGPSRSSYEKYAPSGSFIHVDDFESAGLLGKYLQRLGENDDEYSEFLKWKSILYPKHDFKYPAPPNVWKSLCDIIKGDSKEHKIIDHLDTWWYGEHYTAENTQSISECHQEGGTSGRDLHIPFFYSYHIIITLLFIITCAIVIFKERRNKVRKELL